MKDVGGSPLCDRCLRNGPLNAKKHGTLELWPLVDVSRQLQAVDCDVDGGIVMKEIAVGLCVARGLLSSLSRIPT
jgi:hypothetical protein